MHRTPQQAAHLLLMVQALHVVVHVVVAEHRVALLLVQALHRPDHSRRVRSLRLSKG